MNVLVVTHYFEPDSGAAAVRLSRLARQLADFGHTVSVLTTMPHYPEGRVKSGYRWRLYCAEKRGDLVVKRCWLWSTSSKKIAPKLVSQLSFMLTSCLRGFFLKRPDVVLLEAQPMFTGLSGRIFSRWKGVPYVLNVSDLWPDHLLSVGALKNDDLIYRCARSVVDNTYQKSAKIVALSNGWATRISDYVVDKEKISVIYNGVDLKRFSPSVEPTQRFAQFGWPDRKVLAFVGTFATQYDVEAMLAVANHFGRRDDVSVVFVGSGSQEKQIRQGVGEINSPFRWPHLVG